ncbi:MAG: hypothetical protein K9I69_05440 [Ignavibacteriales bacterium]|nr:hypothetical protein [Ignavibacteriales bacterium]MCF8305425.1 hypothetical protein [Ignavibacteriales bacterium]MCF8316108.1 hypothetical protein [Ignavibacteriales bacterium]MCF8436610.1 hypothetical protein [Ignavibacteriales bacterium]
MNRFIMMLFALLMIFSSASVNAQPRMNIEDRLKSLQDELKLSEAQFAKIKVILEDQQKEMRKLRENMDTSGDREAMREKFMKSAQKTDSLIEEVLDDAQKEKYKKLIADRMRAPDRRRDRM